MKGKIILFGLLALIAKADEPYNSFIEHWEGRKYGVYIDSMGNPSIGVGFNLKVASEDLKKIAAKGEMNDAQINYFLERNVIAARMRAAKLFDSFYKQPENVRCILVDMSYNLGDRLKNFISFRAAIDNYDYKLAADELVHSKWFAQVGKRSLHHYWELWDMRKK